MIYPTLKKSLWQLVGPSVLFVALSISGGEMLLWPELIAHYGLLIIWVMPIILFFQYSVNIEIERYTLATGKNTLTRLASITPLIQWITIISITISLLWPAWITTSGAMVGYLLGFPQAKTYISIVLLGIILLLWNNKNSYMIIETGAKIGLSVVLSISFGIVLYTLGIQRLPLVLGTQLIPDRADSVNYVAALAFGGVTGVLNLVQSDWITARKYGATSLSADEVRTIDWDDTNSQNNWKNWLGIITKEHFLLFFMGNIVGIIIIGIVASFSLRGFIGGGFDLLTHQIEYLRLYSPLLGIAWGLGIILLFMMAQVTILDAAGKLLKRVQLPIFASTSHAQLSQYIGLLGILILIIGLLIPTFSQPASLLKISAVLSAVVMSLYPPLLLHINSQLPLVTRPNLIARIGTLGCSVFYGGVVIWMISTFV